MSQIKPVILHKASSNESWHDPQRGQVQWHTLFSAGKTPTESLTAGVAEIQPGDQLRPHHHPPPEMYFILEGNGVVTIDGQAYPVVAETAVFIPGAATHGIKNTGETILRFVYVFAVDSFNEVAYFFPE